MRRGVYGGSFEPEVESWLPSAGWGGPNNSRFALHDGCTVNGQFATRPAFSGSLGGENICVEAAVEVSYRFLDWDHDGDLDLVTNMHLTGDALPGGDFGNGIMSVDNPTEPDNGSCPDGTTRTSQDSGGADHCVCPEGEVPNSDGTGCQDVCSGGSTYNPSTATCGPTCDTADGCTNGPWNPPDPGTPGGPPSGPGVSGCSRPIEPYGWVHIFYNENLRFHPEATLSDGTPSRYALSPPVPLPSNGGQFNAVAPLYSAPPSLPTLIDIDGDGALDLITIDEDPYRPDVGDHVLGGYDTVKIFVYRGYGTTEGQDFASTPVEWPLPTWGVFDDSAFVTNDPSIWTSRQSVALTDIDGDGLPDLLVQSRGEYMGRPTADLHIAYNLDGAFSLFQPLGFTWPVGQQRHEMQAGVVAGSTFGAGWRADQVLVTDVDRDGRQDLVRFPEGSGGISQAATSRRVYHLGDGSPFDAFMRPEYEALERLIRATNAKAWFRRSDWVDLTGDGRPDAVTFDENGMARVSTDAPGTPPERLLVSIDNGRGALTSFTYAPSTDPTVVAVTPGMRNEARWVVRSMTVFPGAGQPAITTMYSYGQPVFGHEYGEIAPRFLGYTQTTVDHSGQAGGSSSRKVIDYAYTLDPGGYPVSEWTYRNQGGAMVPESNTTSTWFTAWLGTGTVSKFRGLNSRVTRTCALGATVAACAAESRNKVTENFSWSSPVTSSGARVAYTNDRIWEIAPKPVGALTDQRVTQWSFQMRYGQAPYGIGDYRILQTSEERKSSTGGSAMSRTSTTYDAYGLPTSTRVYTSSSYSSRTERTFDSTTGNVLTVKRPNAVAGQSPKLTSFTYDSNKLFVATTLDELYQFVSETRDVATGALLRREGPNKRTSASTVYEPETWTYDALGRPTGHSVATGYSSGYVMQQIEQFTYNDSATPNTLVRSAFTGTTWIPTTDTVDGLGRVVQRRQGSVPASDTFYAYDAGGQTQSITSPDPRDDGAMVATVYFRDGVGRVIAMTRPDGTEQLISYEGPVVRVQDRGPEGYGPLTRMDHDPFGRLTLVHEPDASGDHLTRYTYDALDQITSIVDADGKTTLMTYDMAGHRTKVQRGTRYWSYAYDRNGNLFSTISPYPSGANQTLYQTTTTYDDLDRPLVHTPATRGMDASRLAALGIGPISTTYDTATNGVGLPAQTTLPFGTITYTYDVQHRVSRETRALTLGHGIVGTTTQHVDRTYDLLGSPTAVTFDDGTKWTTEYDTRGMVDTLRWWPSAMSYQTLADYTRSLAGPPRSRSSTWPVQREWTYDALGRVTRDHIHRVGTALVDRYYGYDGLGRLAATTGTVNGQDADADYEFDDRGRLATASVGTTYSASMTYSPAGNITHASVVGALDAPTRDVTYQYGAVDPQAVDRLIAADGSTWGSLAYDLAGNLTTRQLPTGTWNITSDGDDQIREVAGPNGTETYYFGPRAERVASFGPEGIKLWFGESETHFNSVGGAQMLRHYHVGAGEPIARITKPASGPSTVELQFADTLQNLVVTVGGSATAPVTSSFLYGGFGEVVWQSGESTHRRQFNGKEADATSGLRHYGFRSYDPVLLRWTAGDPLYRFVPDAAWAEPQRANIYAFSLNNPVRYFDPDGRDVEGEKEEESPKYEAPCGVEGKPACLQVGTTAEEIGGTLLMAAAALPIGPVTAALFVMSMPSDQGSWQGDPSGNGELELNRFSNMGRILEGRGGPPEPQTAPATDALPAGNQVEASWGAANHYNEGGTMSTIEHINYRHAADSGAQNVSRFAPGTSVRNIRNMVNEALQNGTVTEAGGAYRVEYDFGRAIGTNQAGGPASMIRVWVRNQIIQTAFPF